MLTSDLPIQSGRAVSGEWAGWHKQEASTAKWQPQGEFYNFGRFYQSRRTFFPMK